MTITAALVTEAQPERSGILHRLASDTGYVMGAFPLAIVSFTVMMAGLSAGLGLVVIVVGLPVLAATILAARLFADIERLRIPGVLNRPRSRPTYRTSKAGDGIWKRITTPLAQSQSWLDAAHGILIFPLAVTTFCIVLTWWVAAIGGTLTVAWDWSIPRGPDNQSLAQLIGLGDSTFARVGFQTRSGCSAWSPSRSWFADAHYPWRASAVHC